MWERTYRPEHRRGYGYPDDSEYRTLLPRKAAFLGIRPSTGVDSCGTAHHRLFGRTFQGTRHLGIFGEDRLPSCVA